MIIIPIQANIPSQKFSITLDDIAYNMVANWNSRAAFWTLDIQDENEISIINGIALKAGNDLLEPFNFTLNQPLHVIDQTEQGVEPSLSNIGEETVLVYGN